MSDADPQSDQMIPESDADPFEINETYASLFDDLGADQFKSLKASIRDYGVDTPIIIDAENNVIDGHHRVRAVRELRADGHDIPDIPFVQRPTRVDTLRARRANLARRDGHKKAGVQDYLREHLPEPPEAADTDAEVMWPDGDDAWTQQGVAHELGVSKNTVRRAVDGSIHIVHLDNLNIPSEREQKRDDVRSYIEEHPDATDAEVAEAVDWDISQPTVYRWRNEWSDDEDEDDDGTEQASLLGAGDDAEQTSEIAQDAADGEETATEALAEEGTTTPEAATETRDEKQKEQQIEADERRRDEQREAFDEAVASNDAVDIRGGDFVAVLDEYDDGSLDHIITDPPYHEGALEQWRDLTTVARQKLKPGGYLVAYSGQTYLPQVFDILSSELDYIWQLTVSHDTAQKHPHHSIGIQYKPVLVFGNETKSYRGPLINDVIDTGTMEKSDHDWQQSVIEASELVEKFTEPNDLICDPMCGSGTTGVAALRNDRRALLIDIDDDAVGTARERIGKVVADD